MPEKRHSGSTNQSPSLKAERGGSPNGLGSGGSAAEMGRIPSRSA